MGNGNSTVFFEQPNIVHDFALQLKSPDKINVIHGGRNITDIIRVSLSNFGLLQREEYHGESLTYNFKLHGNPFIIPYGLPNEENFDIQFLFLELLSSFFRSGYEAVMSSDLSQNHSISVIFFRERTHISRFYSDSFVCISPSQNDKLLLLNVPIIAAEEIILMFSQTWSVQKTQVFPNKNVHKIQLAGFPWSFSSSRDSGKFRECLLKCILIMRRHNYSLKLNINFKGNIDSFFFQYDSQKYNESSNDFDFMMHLSQRSHLRFVNASSTLIEKTRSLLQQNWTSGLESESQFDKTIDFKLSGTPWLCNGVKTVSSRILIAQILQLFYKEGWESLVTFDISKRLDDKSNFVFHQGVSSSRNSEWCVISFHEYDKIRLTASDKLTQILTMLENRLSSFHCVQDKRVYDKSMEWKINGRPFLGMAFRNVSQEITLLSLIFILKDMTEAGWKLVSSADISGKYVLSRENSHPLDLHSWFFLSEN